MHVWLDKDYGANVNIIYAQAREVSTAETKRVTVLHVVL